MSTQATAYVAPIAYVYSTVLLIGFIVLGLTLYRAWLPSWVQAARRPVSLRLLVACLTGGALLVVTLHPWFWSPLWFFPLGPDPFFGWPWIFWIVVVLWIATLIIVVPIARRSRYAS